MRNEATSFALIVIPDSQLSRLTKGERFEDIPLSSKQGDLSDMSDDPATAEEAKKALEKCGKKLSSLTTYIYLYTAFHFRNSGIVFKLGRKRQ